MRGHMAPSLVFSQWFAPCLAERIRRNLTEGAPDPSAESSSPALLYLLHVWCPNFCEVVFCSGRLPSRYQPDSFALIFISALRRSRVLLPRGHQEVTTDLKADSQSGTWPCASSCFLLCVHLENVKCSARMGVLCSPG